MRAPWEPLAYYSPVVFEPATLTIIATAAVVAGTAITAYSAIQQGEAASNAAKFNSQIASRNSLIAGQQADAAAEQQQRENRLRLGAIRAAAGGSGVSSDGSPLDILEDSASQGELDRQNILYRGRLKQLGYSDSSALDNYRASTATSNSYASAGSALLVGGAKAYSTYGGGGTSLNQGPGVGAGLAADFEK